MQNLSKKPHHWLYPLSPACQQASLQHVSGAGLTAGTASLEESLLGLTLQLLPSNPLAEAACTAAGQPDSLQLPVLVQPSTAPASIVLLVGDDTLPYAVRIPQLLIIC